MDVLAFTHRGVRRKPPVFSLSVTRTRSAAICARSPVTLVRWVPYWRCVVMHAVPSNREIRLVEVDVVGRSDAQGISEADFAGFLKRNSPPPSERMGMCSGSFLVVGVASVAEGDPIPNHRSAAQKPRPLHGVLAEAVTDRIHGHLQALVPRPRRPGEEVQLAVVVAESRQPDTERSDQA